MPRAMWVRFWNFLDGLFFGPRSQARDAIGAALRVLRYPYAVVRDLSRGVINQRATALVFTTLLSLIPLIAFAFAILKVFGAHRELAPIVFEFFRPLGEAGAHDLTGRVMLFADRVSSRLVGLVGVVGFALLLWTLLGTIKKVEDSFNFLWRVEQPRSWCAPGSTCTFSITGASRAFCAWFARSAGSSAAKRRRVHSRRS